MDIVLYRRDPAFSEGEERLGHVLLCDISPGEPEQSEIELVLDLGDDGTIAATAIDRRSGNRRDVSIDQRDATPEFIEDDTYIAGDVRELVEEEEAPRRKGGVIAFLLWLLLVVAIGFLVWWFLLREAPMEEHAAEAATGDTAAIDTAGTGETDTAEGGTDSTASDAESVDDATAPGATESIDAADAGEAAAVLSGESPAAESPAAESPAAESPGQAYRIRWGDTLWDISRMFYGTPWRFRDIAEENRISDPDRIFAEDEITIP